MSRASGSRASGRRRGAALDLPLRVVIPLVILVVGGVLLTVYTFVEVAEDRREAEADIRERVVERLTAVVPDIEAAERRRDPDQARRAVTLLRNMRDLEVAALIDPSSRVVASTWFALENREVGGTTLRGHGQLVGQARRWDRPAVRTIDDGRLLLGSAPVVMAGAREGEGTGVGVLLVEIDLTRARAEAWRESVQDALRSAGILGALSLIVWWLIDRRLGLRVDRLVGMADEIAAGELEARSRLEGGGELARIGRAMDAMAARLEAETEALRRSERWFRELIEHGSDVILALDEEYRIAFASPSLERTLGRDAEQVIARQLDRLVHPEDAEGLRAALEEALAEPGRSRSVEWRLERPDGSWRILEAAVTAPGPGADTALILNARDVTGRRRLEAELVQARKMEAVGRLAGGVAHDFNNLLTVILGRLEIALEQSPDGVAIRPGLEQARAAAQRAAEVTQQLLAFGRKQMLRPEVVDLNALSEETMRLLDRLVGERIRVAYDLEPALPPVRIDPTRLRQVLMNLTVNARDAMPDGGSITISTRSAEVGEADVEGVAAGRWVVMSVADDGSGMEADVVERMFEPFFTTKEVGEGTGLGLAAVLGVVEQSGGHVAVDSSPGKGTVVSIYLPPVVEPTESEITATGRRLPPNVEMTDRSEPS